MIVLEQNNRLVFNSLRAFHKRQRRGQEFTPSSDSLHSYKKRAELLSVITFRWRMEITDVPVRKRLRRDLRGILLT
jgi:hypothetical protein